MSTNRASRPGDRTVHAAWDQMEVVRYDKAGKWYLEPLGFPGLPRQAVNIKQAVEYAVWLQDQPSGRVFLGRYGGGAFDARFRAATNQGSAA